MKIQSVTSCAFQKYGKILENYDFNSLLEEMQKTPLPEDVTYIASSEINVAVTDLILLVGCQQDIEEDFTYNTAKIEAIFAFLNIVLHTAPFAVKLDEFFRCSGVHVRNYECI